MYTIRVTNLEKFRRFRDEETETYDTEQSVIDSLSGSFVGNDLTYIGSAFHKIIEKFNTDNPETEESIFNEFGVKFSNEQGKIAQNHAFNMYPFLPEIPNKKIYDTFLGKIQVTGTTDVLQGTVLRDTKTKFTPPVMQDYYRSYQWRLYLDMFGLDRFIYDVFEFSGHNGKDVSEFEIKQHEPFECLRYEKMEQDIQILLNDFMGWIQLRNLYHLITI